MTTQISSKLAALAVALTMNTMLMFGVAYLFNSQLHQHSTVMALAQAAGHAAQSIV